MAVIIGIPLGESLEGTAGADTIDGRGGNDTIFGLGGPDTLFGSGGNDTLFGGGGQDDLYGGAGSDRAYGGANDDIVFGQGGNDTIEGNGGDDFVYGGAGSDRVYGDGSTLNSFQSGNDVINGGLGNDILRGDSPSQFPLVNLGFDIFEWTNTASIGSSSASNVEVDRIEDFNALPTILDGILGIDHIDLSSILTMEDVDDGDLKIVENVGGNKGRTWLLIDTNDDAKNAFDLKIDVFSNKGVDWNVGFYGNADAEIWVG